MQCKKPKPKQQQKTTHICTFIGCQILISEFENSNLKILPEGGVGDSDII